MNEANVKKKTVENPPQTVDFFALAAREIRRAAIHDFHGSLPAKSESFPALMEIRKIRHKKTASEPRRRFGV